MSEYEYRTVPARDHSLPARILGTGDAMSLTEAVNLLAGEGWTYMRRDRLDGLARLRALAELKTHREVLVFRRPRRTGDRVGFGTGRAPAPTERFAHDFDALRGGLAPLASARAA